MSEAQWFPTLRANVTAQLMPMALPLEGAPGIEILCAVCREFGVGVADMKSPGRHASLAGARQMFMFLARQHAKHLSYPQIGRLIGRDHTTIIYGVGRAAERMQRDPEYAAKRRRIVTKLAYGQ